MSKTNLANPFDDAAAPILLETPEDSLIENPAKKTANVIKLSEEDLRRERLVMPREPREGAEESYRCVANKGKLDAGRTVRSGYAYDFDSTDPVSPRDVARAAGIKAELGDEPLHGIENRYAYRFVKRAFDIVFSIAIIVAFSWLFIIIAIAVKVDDPKGPVLFKQLRCTKGGRQFYMLKFRSMCVDAEEKLAELHELNEKSGSVFKIADDPRITRVGKVIRKLSLDELPQFINVLNGDIPLRILKTRLGTPCGSRSAFALPAYEERTQMATFLQVEGLNAESLQASPESFDKFTPDTANVVMFFAKLAFRWEGTTFFVKPAYRGNLDRSACLGATA